MMRNNSGNGDKRAFYTILATPGISGNFCNFFFTLQLHQCIGIVGANMAIDKIPGCFNRFGVKSISMKVLGYSVFIAFEWAIKHYFFPLKYEKYRHICISHHHQYHHHRSIWPMQCRLHIQFVNRLLFVLITEQKTLR